jgi:hypothetical protein
MVNQGEGFFLSAKGQPFQDIYSTATFATWLFFSEHAAQSILLLNNPKNFGTLETSSKSAVTDFLIYSVPIKNEPLGNAVEDSCILAVTPNKPIKLYGIRAKIIFLADVRLAIIEQCSKFIEAREVTAWYQRAQKSSGTAFCIFLIRLVTWAD